MNLYALLSPKWSIAISVLMIAAGVLAIAAPLLAGVAISAFVGWILVFGGLLHVAFAWRSGSTGATVWEILLGLLYGAIGLYLLARPIAGLASLTLALAVYLLIEAALELALAFQGRRTRGTGWLIFDAVVTLVLAAMIGSTWPWSAAWAIGTLVGISILFSGVSRLMLTLALRRIAS